MAVPVLVAVAVMLVDAVMDALVVEVGVGVPVPVCEPVPVPEPVLDGVGVCVPEIDMLRVDVALEVGNADADAMGEAPVLSDGLGVGVWLRVGRGVAAVQRKLTPNCLRRGLLGHGSGSGS